jgi:glycosyltransferase involved in cell wall biosynthesis
MRLYLAAAADAVAGIEQRPRLVLDLDDLDWVRERRLAAPERADAYERWAAHFLPTFDDVLTTSAADAAEVMTKFATRTTVIPNGVRIPASVTRSERRHDLLFVGNLSYEPNARGAVWLCRDVLAHLGDVSVALVGANPSAEVLALASDPRVTIAPDVADVAPWYASAAVAVVPLWAGSGTRTKVLEAWAHQVPVVSTSIGVEGLDAQGAAAVADDAAAFAAACRRLLDHSDDTTKLVQTGLARAKSATTGRAAESLARLLRP